MNRRQALQQLDNMFKIGFSYLNVRELINKIYDNVEGLNFSQVTTNMAQEKGKVNNSNTKSPNSLSKANFSNQVKNNK